MKIESLEISEVKLIKPRVFQDERGFFQQCYHSAQYRDAGIDVEFVQDNWSRSHMNVLRGLHYQLEHGQDKMVYVVSGEIFDVAVDIRPGSPTFGNWTSAYLSAENHRQIFVPRGFAHGFLVLSEVVDIIYKCSDFYYPDDSYGISWNDPDLGIEWPLENVSPILSSKDENQPRLISQSRKRLPLYASRDGGR